MQWFRMYAEMPDDPKIGTLSDAAFRTWVELLCVACKIGKGGKTDLTEETLNWALRRNVTETLQELLQKHLVTVSETKTIEIINWNKRQYLSDNSTERVRKYRENKKNKDETFQKRYSNALDTDTDTDKRKKVPKKNGKRFSPPTLQDVKAYCEERNNGVNPERFMSHYESNGWKVGRNAMKNWKAAVRTWENRNKQQNPEDPLEYAL